MARTKDEHRVYMRRWRERKRAEAAKEQGIGIAGANGAHRAAQALTGDLAEDVAKYIESLGIALQPWQAGFLVDALAPGVAVAGLSAARASGKTTFAAALACAGIDGPMAGDGEVLAIAGSTQQARILFEGAESLLSGAGAAVKAVRSPHMELRGPRGRLRVLASNPRTLLGLQPKLALCDEPATWPRADSARMFRALRTAAGKRRGSKLVALGTLSGEDPDGWFTRLMHSPTVGERAHLHQAPKGADLADESAWAAANPRIPYDELLRETYRVEAEQGRRVPALAAQFVADRFNRADAEDAADALVSLPAWKAIERHDCPQLAGRTVLGVDLGGAESQSAAVAWSLDTGAIRAWGAFPRSPDLATRGAADAVGARYLRQHDAGDLRLHGQMVVDVGEFLAAVFGEMPADCRIVRIGCDRFRKSEGEPILSRFAPISWRGTGRGAYATGSADIRALQRAVLARRIVAPVSELLRTSLSESVVTYDSLGNGRLGKARSRGRIDAAQALCIAAGLAAEEAAKPAPTITTVPAAAG